MDVEVTVKKLRKPATVYILLIVGVASVAECWRQNPQISLSRGVVVFQSTFHLCISCITLLRLIVFGKGRNVIVLVSHSGSRITQKLWKDFSAVAVEGKSQVCTALSVLTFIVFPVGLLLHVVPGEGRRVVVGLVFLSDGLPKQLLKYFCIVCSFVVFCVFVCFVLLSLCEEQVQSFGLKSNILAFHFVIP